MRPLRWGGMATTTYWAPTTWVSLNTITPWSLCAMWRAGVEV